MSIVTVTSTNPNLSYILSKNPATILEQKVPFERELRKGRVYGWFTNLNNSEFRLLFIDSPIDNSFGANEEFEYLDIGRYSNPYIPVLMIGAALNSAANKEHEQDTGEFNTSVTFTISCPLNILKRFNVMKDMNVEYELISDKHFQVVVSDTGVMKALNKAILICIIACLADDDVYVPLPEAGITKYLNVLNRADAPYYLRHLFVSRGISNRSLFEKLRSHIDTDTIHFEFGNTQVQRFSAIKKALLESKDFFNKTERVGSFLHDIGCGEMYNTFKFLNKYESIFAIDADQEVFEANEGRLKKKQVTTVTPVHTTAMAWAQTYSFTPEDDVLLSEVIEHMEKKEAQEFLVTLLKTDVNRVVITVPNKIFNTHYNIDDSETRHHDHKWEPTKLELIEFIAEILQDIGKENPQFKRSITFEDVGDSVKTAENGEQSVSLLVNIR